MQSAEQTITCKVTPWFLLRALVMLAMFGVFSVLFFIDGTTGYRKKNLEYYIHASFETAASEYKKLKVEGDVTPESWLEFSQKQSVALPKDLSLLPVGTKAPMPWPKILTDHSRIKSGQPHLLWQEYSGENRMSNDVAEKPFDAGKIREQIIVFYICLTLSLCALFILIRTLRRSVSVDGMGLKAADGKTIPFAAMKTLDLRKWDTKGIAFIDYAGESGSGRTKIDGLTYGGFKKEQEEPAERLMQRIRENFSGEIIEYTRIAPESGENTEPAKA